MKKILLITILCLGIISFGENYKKDKADEIKKENKTVIEKVKTTDGLSLHLTKDFPLNKEIKGVLIISHGLASHSGIFENFSKEMNENGIAVYRFDHRGHGKSGGRDTIHIKNFFEMVDDLDIIVKKVKKENSGKPVFILGHSMGGHVASLYGIRSSNQVNGYIFAAAVPNYSKVDINSTPLLDNSKRFVNVLSEMHKTLNLPEPKIEAGLSLPNDPLMLEKVSVSFFNGYKEGIIYLKKNQNKFVDSVLILGGDADEYVIPQDSMDFYSGVSSQDKSLRLYNNIGHMLFFEKGGDLITHDIAEWIKRRI